MRYLLAGCLVVGALAACDPGSQALFLTANVVSYVQTDKTLVDHGITYASGEDCSTLTWAEGQGYCRREDASEDLAMEPAAAGPFCYRSIGSIVCYSEPDPNADADLLVTPPTPPSFQPLRASAAASATASAAGALAGALADASLDAHSVFVNTVATNGTGCTGGTAGNDGQGLFAHITTSHQATLEPRASFHPIRIASAALAL